MSWGVVFGIIGIILLVGLIVHFMVDKPQIENNKETLGKEQTSFLAENEIVISNEYSYTDNYYSNSISWKDSIYVRFIIDRVHSKVAILSSKEQQDVIPFEDIIGCETMVDSQVTGGVGRAVVGGILAGGAGAVVGAITAKNYIMSYKVVIYTRNISIPKIEMILIDKKKSTKDSDYISATEFAENVTATIKAIINADMETQNNVLETEVQSVNRVIIGECPDKIKLIKAIKELQGVTLDMAKNIADSGIICEAVTRDEALQIQNKYKKHGVSLKIVEN